MRIGFDARMIDHPGIGRYIRNLLKAILGKVGSDVEFVLYGDPQKLADFKNCGIRAYKKEIYSIGEYICAPFNKDGLDVIHIPHFNVPFCDLKNLVITIHDLIYLKFPESSTFIKRFFARSVISNAIKKANRIIAVSENTKKDIAGYFPDAKNRIRVIYEAADPVFRSIDDELLKQKIRERYNLPEKIILFVSSLKNHKNMERLIDAYSGLKSKGIRHRLVIVGRYSPRESDILEKIKATGAIYLGEIPTQDLVIIYNLSSALIMPSLYEGFGLPALEAMACGVPVAASSASSLPEIIQDAGIFFNPLSVTDMSEAIYKVLTDEHLRLDLVKRGFKRMKQFSWDKAADETLRLYGELL